jgi:hypothetical protein
VLDPELLPGLGQRELAGVVADGVRDGALAGGGDRAAKLVVASRSGGNATPCGVVIVSGIDTST